MRALIGMGLLMGASAALAGACEENFRVEGDPRNGAEYFASTLLPELTVPQAIAQLRSIATADGFNVLGEELNATDGKLTIEQSKGARPFLIHLNSVQKERSNEVSIQTRLNRGATARAEDMRQAMCGMLSRVKTGEEGAQAAAQVRANQGPTTITDTTPKDLADEIYRVSQKVEAEVVTARYKGRRYRIDGQIAEPLVTQGTVEIWYRVRQEASWLLGERNNKSNWWPEIVCRLAKSEVSKTKRLQSGDWAKLTGTVSHFWRGQPNRLVLEDCKFE